MYTPPRVAIVIPTYNHAEFLRGALDSIMAQTVQDWEAVIINNFSDDNTIEVIQSYQDPRISCVNYANHGIIAASRNRGIYQSSAPYIAFLDSDDWWHPTKLERCLQKLEQGYDLVCHAEKWLGPEERSRDVYYGPEARARYERLLYDGNCISTSATVVKRTWVQRVGGFSQDTNIVTAEDYDFWLKLAHVGARIGFIQEILGAYRIHAGNQSRAALRNMHAVMEVIEQHIQALGSYGLISWLRARRRRALVFYSGARGLQDSGEYYAAWPLFFKAFLQFPFVARFYAAMLLNAMRRRP